MLKENVKKILEDLEEYEIGMNTPTGAKTITLTIRDWEILLHSVTDQTAIKIVQKIYDQLY